MHIWIFFKNYKIFCSNSKNRHKNRRKNCSCKPALTTIKYCYEIIKNVRTLWLAKRPGVHKWRHTIRRKAIASIKVIRDKKVTSQSTFTSRFRRSWFGNQTYWFIVRFVLQMFSCCGHASKKTWDEQMNVLSNTVQLSYNHTITQLSSLHEHCFHNVQNGGKVKCLFFYSTSKTTQHSTGKNIWARVKAILSPSNSRL